MYAKIVGPEQPIHTGTFSNVSHRFHHSVPCCARFAGAVCFMRLPQDIICYNHHKQSLTAQHYLLSVPDFT